MFSYGGSEMHIRFDRETQLDYFRKNAILCADYICEYIKNAPKRSVYPDVKPGYLRPLLPKEPPQDPEPFQQMLQDFHKLIIPGTLHWNHPDMYAYYPHGTAPCNALSDILITAIGGVNFSWVSKNYNDSGIMISFYQMCVSLSDMQTSNPASTELENIVMDWLCNAFGLPAHFNFIASNGKGGGCLHNTASDAILSVAMAARHRALERLGCYDSDGEILIHPSKYLPKLVAYTSSETHSSTQKAANLSLCTIRILTPNHEFQLTGKILEKAIKKDLADGLIPFMVTVSVGSTGGAAYDDMMTVGPIAKKYNMWMHVDGAYGGNTFILPEKQHFKWGIEYVDSIEINPSKLLNATHESTCLWIKDVAMYKKPHQTDATYLLDEAADEPDDIRKHAIDYRHYGIPLSRKFRSLRLWILLRTFGLKELRQRVRNVIRLAKYFEQLVLDDKRFEVTNIVEMGVVCFRQRPNDATKAACATKRIDAQSFLKHQNCNLLHRINRSRKIHLVPTTLRGEYTLRLSVAYIHATEKDLQRAWQLIQSMYVTELDDEYRSAFQKDGTGRRCSILPPSSFVKVVDDDDDEDAAQSRRYESGRYSMYDMCSIWFSIFLVSESHWHQHGDHVICRHPGSSNMTEYKQYQMIIAV